MPEDGRPFPHSGPRRGMPARIALGGSGGRTAAGGAVIAAPPRSNALSEQSGAPRRSVASPPIDADEEEQPDHVDEVPVPGRRLEAEVVIRLEVAGAGPEEADDEEDRKSTRLHSSN